ncbi:hypothetical protein [Lactococcus lactis]|uniref:hypothetical protein n=1 Tax=Lactococcus lactis TaxID=1358 RepID=UPI00321A03D0
MEKFKVQCKTIEIKSDFTKPSWKADILIDGESLFNNGKGITKIIYEGESIEFPQLIIEGDSDKMTEFIKNRLIPIEEKQSDGEIMIDVDLDLNLEQEIINFIAAVLKKEETKENPAMVAAITELYKALT